MEGRASLRNSSHQPYCPRRSSYATGDLQILEHEAAQQDEAVDSAKNTWRLFTDRYVGGRDSYLQVITAQTACGRQIRQRECQRNWESEMYKRVALVQLQTVKRVFN